MLLFRSRIPPLHCSGRQVSYSPGPARLPSSDTCHLPTPSHPAVVGPTETHSYHSPGPGFSALTSLPVHTESLHSHKTQQPFPGPKSGLKASGDFPLLLTMKTPVLAWSLLLCMLDLSSSVQKMVPGAPGPALPHPGKPSSFLVLVVQWPSGPCGPCLSALSSGGHSCCDTA